VTKVCEPLARRIDRAIREGDLWHDSFAGAVDELLRIGLRVVANQLPNGSETVAESLPSDECINININTLLEEGGMGGETSSRGEKVAEQLPFGSDSATSKPKTVKIKPVARPLEELELELPEACRASWNDFKAMCAARNKSKTTTTGRMAGMLTEITARCKELTPSAIAYGLETATYAENSREGGEGVPNAMFVFRCASNYDQRGGSSLGRNAGSERYEEPIVRILR
jgi:hypothetical protein